MQIIRLIRPNHYLNGAKRSYNRKFISFIVHKKYTTIFLNKRFEKKIRQIPGTQSLHAFIPVDANKIMASTLSTSEQTKTFTLV